MIRKRCVATTCGKPADSYAPRVPLRVITLAGLLTCASSFSRAFPIHYDGPVASVGLTLRLQLRGQSRHYQHRRTTFPLTTVQPPNQSSFGVHARSAPINSEYDGLCIICVKPACGAASRALGSANFLI